MHTGKDIEYNEVLNVRKHLRHLRKWQQIQQSEGNESSAT